MLKHTNTKYNSHPELLLFSGILSLTLLSATLLASSHATADNDTAVDNISIEVPVSCTMSGTGQNSHEATLLPGTYSGASGSTYESGIGTTTLTTFCNDNNGFSIYAIGYSNDTDGNNTLIGENTSLTIPTKVYESTDTTSNWSMKVNKVENQSGQEPVAWSPENMTITNSFSSWHTVPDDYVQVAEYKAQTGSSATDTTLGGKVTTTYAAYISTDQAADTYTGKVKYVMVHPYDHTAPTSEVSLCGSNEYIMQNVNDWKSSVASGTEVTACDNRDGKTYTVAHLADGNLWMTQNLDLDLDSTKTYTSADTDISADWQPAASTATGSTTWTMSTSTPESYDPGDLYWNGTISDYSDWDAYYGTCTYDYNTGAITSCSGTSPLSTHATSTSSTPQYHLGNYYNWTAAVAMNNSSSHATEGELIEQSICPAGWTLPRTGTGEDSFYALWNSYNLAGTSFIDQDSDNTWGEGETALWTSPLYFPTSGYYYGGVGSVGYDGDFWSPVVDNAEDARYAGFNVDGYANPSEFGPRGNGATVRCLARPVASSISNS